MTEKDDVLNFITHFFNDAGRQIELGASHSPHDIHSRLATELCENFLIGGIEADETSERELRMLNRNRFLAACLDNANETIARLRAQDARN